MPESKNPTARRPQRGRGAAEAEQRRQAARRREARRRMAGLAAVAVAAAAIAAVGLARSGDDGPADGSDAGAAAAPNGTESYDDLSQDHVPGRVDYAQTPPVGGDHSGVWQNCGFYPKPITTEQGVHSMEHGAVWLTYRPDLPAEQIAALQGRADEQTYILASAWSDGLPAPVVASAWGRQLALSGADDAKLDEFIRAFRQGPQAPEPGAPCTGGDSNTP